MRRWVPTLSAILVLTVLRCVAGTVTVTNGPPLHADGEVSTHTRLPSWSGQTRVLRLELALAATPSNNVEVAFGSDADGDGRLPAEETAVTVGWLNGRWFARSEDLRTLCTAEPTGGATNRILSLSIRLGPDATPQITVCTDANGASIILDGLDGILAAARPAEWNTVRLTTRGQDDRGETATIALLVDGTLLLLR